MKNARVWALMVNRQRDRGASRHLNASRRPGARREPVPHHPDPQAIYSREVEALEIGHGEWATGLCPFHADGHPSFSVNLVTGGFVCHATSCGAKGGSVTAFFMLRYGVNASAARKIMEETYG
jgi:CHC2 zinc finger